MATRYAGPYTISMKLLDGLDYAHRPRYAVRITLVEGGKRRHISLEQNLDATTCREIPHDSAQAYDQVALAALRSATTACPSVTEPLSDEHIPWTEDGSGNILITRKRPKAI